MVARRRPSVPDTPAFPPSLPPPSGLCGAIIQRIGTCTLKEIVSSKWKDHVYNANEDPDTTPLMSGMCDWTLKG